MMGRTTTISLNVGLITAIVVLAIMGIQFGFFTSEFGILLAIGAAGLVGIAVGGICYLSMSVSR